jgi:hypothetical protein
VADLAELQRAADDAAARRRLDTDPAVVALGVERARAHVDRLMWFGIGIALVFTTITVQDWAADTATAALYSLVWWSMWGLSALIELPLVATLYGQQVAERYGVTVPPWVRHTRRTLLAFTFLLNTWAAAAQVLGGRWGFGLLLLHAIPPAVILLATECSTALREALTAAVLAAESRAAADARKATKPPRRERRDRRPDERPDERADGRNEQGHSDDKNDKDEQDIDPGVDTPLPTLRSLGVAWALAHWRDDLMPNDIRNGVKADTGRDMSRGEASRCKKDAAKQLGLVEVTG